MVQVSSKSNFVLIVFFGYLFSLGDDISHQAPKDGLILIVSPCHCPIVPLEYICAIIKQRLDEEEITNLNFPKLNIKKILSELDSEKVF